MDKFDAVRRWFQGPRGPFRSASSLLVLLLLFVALHEWISTRPKPRVLSWNASSPAATPLVDGARPEPLRIAFTNSASKLEDIGKPVKKGLSLTPRVRGDWTWASDTELIFTPSEDWPAGQEYVVRFDRGFFPKHVRLEREAGGFRTSPFVATLASSEFHVDPKDPALKQAAATFHFSHPVDTDAFEKRLTMDQLGEKKGLFGGGKSARRFTVTYDKFHGEAYVVSEPLGIPLEAATIEIRAAAGVRPVRGGPPTISDLAAAVRVPSMYDYFRIESAEAALVRNERLEPEQVLVIGTSGGVGERQLAAAIRAYILPSTKPAAGGDPAIANYYWRSEMVGPEAIKLSTPLALTAIPAEREYPARHTFKFRAPPGSHVHVKIPRGLVAYGGYVQAKDFEETLRLPEFPREIKILHEGALLRLSGEKKLSLYSLGERAVRLEIGRVRPSELNNLASQTEGDFSNPRFQGWSFGQDNITERFEDIRDFGKVEPDRLHFFAYDFTPRLQAPGSGTRNGLFFLRAEGWDVKHKRATCGADTRFILITDLGVLVKENADKTRDVFVQSLASGEPVAGARVEAVGLNGLVIASASTDASGKARLPDLTGYVRERRPAAFVIRHEEDLAFMPFDRQDRLLDVSRFDVGGDSTRGRERELSADLFSDRGLYRPGEAFHVGFLVRPTIWGQELTGVPLEVSIQDPRGLEVKKLKLALSAAGFEAVEYQTQENGPTGTYQVMVYIVKDGRRSTLLGSTSVRVEEFLPDRLRIAARFSHEAAEGGWVSPKELKAAISLHNLFGTPAENRRISGRIRLSPAAPSFKEYADYSFFDPQEAKKSFSENLEDAKTDADGAASFDMPLERFAEGTYRLELTAEGFEAEGGRGVAAQAAVLVSPRPHLLGLKTDGSLRYVARGSSRTVTAAAVGPEGRAVAVSPVVLQLLEERWISALVKGSDGLYRYQSVRKELFVSSKTTSLPPEPRNLILDTSSPGDYALVLRDGAGLELNRLHYSVAGHGNLSRSLEKNAELQVRLEKADYAPGGLIELQIKGPYSGAGLISIERDKVYAHKWFRSSVSASTQSIRLPEGVEGNAYVTVSFLRAPDSREIFMSPLSHGIAPFTVSRSRRTLPVTLEAPESTRPGKTIPVRVTTPRRARILIFAADEGILQVAGWKLPDPLAHFLRKRALEVRTYQILDLLLPEYRLSMSVMAPGGDKDGWDAAGKNLNPFKRKRDKPAVFWSGMLETGPEGKEISIPVPDSFNGTLRVTAVAAEPNSIGVAQKKILVRQDIVLSPNAPLFVAPGDEFEASVAVANGVKNSGEHASARVTLKSSGHLEVMGESEKILRVGENRESVAVFRLKSRPAMGAATLTFEAAVSSQTARREVSLSVRPSMPYQVTLETGHLKSGRKEAPTPRRLYPQYRTLEASVSPLPLILAKGLLQYLQKYPYGCTEQVLSQTFPALVLRRRPEFGYAPETVETNLARAVDILRSRQNEDGGFGMWAANSNASPFQAVYAGHFLTEAKEKGYAIPPELLARALSYLNQLASASPGFDAPARVQAYAIYVMTRNGRVTTPLINGLRARLEKEGDKNWRKDLTAAYLASSYSMLHLDGQADDLIRGVSSGGPIVSDWEWFYDDSIHEAQYMYLLALHFPARLAALDADAVLRIVESLQRGRYNSLSAAYTILALDAYADAAGELKPGEARLEEVLEAGGTKALVLPPGLFSKAEFTPAAKAISVENHSTRRLFYQAAQSGYDTTTPKEPVRRKLEVYREILDEKNNVIHVAELGREYKVRLRLRTLDGGRAPNLAVVDLVPGGFEPVWKERSGESSELRGADYQDIREDRVLFFGSADGMALELDYRIKAATRGIFAVPPAFAESMYDRSVSALGVAGKIEVK